jgi:hypothetical protein
MLYSDLTSYFIVLTTGLTLHASGLLVSRTKVMGAFTAGKRASFWDG